MLGVDTAGGGAARVGGGGVATAAVGPGGDIGRGGSSAESSGSIHRARGVRDSCFVCAKDVYDLGKCGFGNVGARGGEGKVIGNVVVAHCFLVVFLVILGWGKERVLGGGEMGGRVSEMGL